VSNCLQRHRCAEKGASPRRRNPWISLNQSERGIKEIASEAIEITWRGDLDHLRGDREHLARRSGSPRRRSRSHGEAIWITSEAIEITWGGDLDHFGGDGDHLARRWRSRIEPIENTSRRDRIVCEHASRKGVLPQSCSLRSSTICDLMAGSEFCTAAQARCGQLFSGSGAAGRKRLPRVVHHPHVHLCRLVGRIKLEGGVPFQPERRRLR